MLGADLPVEGGRAGQFAWRDGPLLRALREGHWLVLDEVRYSAHARDEALRRFDDSF